MNEAQAQTKLNYNTEAEALGGGYLKLDDGKYTITPLEELPVPEPKEFEHNGQKKTVLQAEWKVSCKNKGDQKPKEYLWSITKAGSKVSTWGQIMRLGQSWKTLMGKPFTLLVQTSSGRKQYTIIEAAEIEGVQ